MKRTLKKYQCLGALAWAVCLGSLNAVAGFAFANDSAGLGSFVSPHFHPIAKRGDHVFVANTPNNTLDVIHAKSLKKVTEISVGIDPVSVAIRPDGLEIWVSNHISDSISVIDNDPNSLTHWNVVATIQAFDDKLATSFDEPVGIAFASNDKAYVALSSENQIAVIDVHARKIRRRLRIPAQDPRGIVVSNGRLFVIPFESNNQTQLSGGRRDQIDGNLVTFDAWEHSINHNNVLSLGHVVDIIKHPDVPDRDLFVFDTRTDRLVTAVDTLGTLLYGLTTDSKGNVFIAQTDARNDVNGRSGTKKHDLSQLENRPFLNQVTRVQFENEGKSGKANRWELEPLPPEQPERSMAFATPFAIEVSQDDSVLVASAAGSDRLVLLDAGSGEILSKVDVGSVPRGIALDHEDGKLRRAFVLNAVDNTISVVDVSDARQPQSLKTIDLEDPTHPAIKRGRMAFETASASSTGTFSCASCHPDGHTDQLLWVLKTPVVTFGDQIMPRSTMPVRGLRDTEPYHWDGIPGDPYGGNNSANIHGSDPPNSVEGDALSSIRNLIDGGLASTMVFADEEETNEAGKAGFLSEAERDDMGTFLLNVPFPPAQKRPYTNELTARARRGFELFHVLGDDDPSKSQPNICGDCHRMPYLVSTNTPGTGMDAPTWRGANDRFLILPQGRLNMVEFPFYRNVAERGQSEEEIWRFSWGGRRRFNPVWDMVLQMSTGYSGAFARQVTLDAESLKLEETTQLWRALENANVEGAVELKGVGVRLDSSHPTTVDFWMDGEGQYRDSKSEAGWSNKELIEEIEEGRLVVTLTAYAGTGCDADHPQPAIWTLGPIERQRGRQKFPQVRPGQLEMKMSGRHLSGDSRIFLDGHLVGGEVGVQGELVTVKLSELPEDGLHLLQLQNPQGQFSNDFIFTAVRSGPDSARKESPEGKSRTLQSVLNQSGFETLIGTWVDEGSKGDGLKFSVNWKVPERVLETKSVSPDQTSVSLISVNPSNQEVVQEGENDQGGTHRGRWTFAEKGKASLEIGYTNRDGTEGELSLNYELVDRDTLDLTIQWSEPVRVRLKRVRE
ncbi:MAG: hypothetical protein MK136_17260 [Pirellulaceae bacterium]|nr:hypothetical protein [Pirellulaceae bacterium]